jgi:hypothetical protein
VAAQAMVDVDLLLEALFQRPHRRRAREDPIEIGHVAAHVEPVGCRQGARIDVRPQTAKVRSPGSRLTGGFVTSIARRKRAAPTPEPPTKSETSRTPGRS